MVVASNENGFDLDSVLDELGQFGTYQLINFLLLCMPIAFNAVSTISYVFSAGTPEYRCKIDNCDILEYNSTTNVLEKNYLTPWLNYTMPFRDHLPVPCERYALIQNATIFSNTDGMSCPTEAFNSLKIEECTVDFVFRGEDWTIVNDWNLTCPKNEWYLTIVGSVNNIGQFIGMPLGGFVSDRYGRRFALVTGAVLSALMGTLKSIATNYSMFIAFEFLDSCLGAVVYSAAFILAVELVGANKRVLGLTILSAFYPVGEIALGVVAMYARNWRLTMQILYIPGFLHILYFWIIPESIRWLVAQGRSEDAVKILRKAAKINKTHLSESSLIRLKQAGPNDFDTEASASNNYPLRMAFMSPTLFWRLINCSFCWLTNTFVYYGLSLNSVSLAGDKFINFILISAVEVPAFFIIYFTLEHVGRRFTQTGSLIVSGVSCLAAIFATAGEKNCCQIFRSIFQ